MLVLYVCVQGAHSPGARVLSMGVYPIQAIKSQILDQSDVSVCFLQTKFFHRL